MGLHGLLGLGFRVLSWQPKNQPWTQHKDQTGIESFKEDPIQGPDWDRKFWKGPPYKDQTGIKSFKKDPIQGPDWYQKF